MPASSEPLALSELASILARHRIKIVLWCLFVALSAAAAFIALPKKYISTAKLFVRLGRESVVLDPTAKTGHPVPIQESRENQINTAKDLLSSRVLLDRVVEKFGPEYVLKGPKGAEATGFAAVLEKVKEVVLSIDFSTPVSPEEQAVDKLAGSLKVESARNSSVIDVQIKSKSPQQAQQLLKNFLSAYQDEYVSANRTSGSQEFFEQQTSALKTQFQEASAKLRDLKNKSGLVSIPVEQQALQSQLVQIEAQLMASRASQSSSEAAIGSMKASLSAQPEQLETGETHGFPNVARDYMQQELYRLQVELAGLESSLEPDHPRLQMLREKVQQATSPVTVEATERVQATKAVNPSRQTLLLDLNREQAAYASHQAKTLRLEEQYADLRERLKVLNDQEIKIATLEHEVALAQSNYRNYAENYEQARIDQALEASRISPVNIVQPPSLIEKPVSPKLSLILLVALGAAMTGSCALAFGSEFLRRPSNHRKPLVRRPTTSSKTSPAPVESDEVAESVEQLIG